MEKEQPPQFKLLDGQATGLSFINHLEPTLHFNIFNNMYFYNGAGVSAGDVNNDGLIDLFFTSNQEANRLFLNEGNIRFTDVTEEAKIGGLSGWSSGTCFVDINNDGLLDIYVSQIGDFGIVTGKNQLYICLGLNDSGIPVYEDQAINYGLDLIGFSTQASFFDYDLDGDLDMYMLNHSLHQNGTFGQRHTFVGTKHPTAGDKLMRNDGSRFIEVTMEAGIESSVVGYGLGVVTGDVNLDGWPDIYIGNDFHENDYLYINQQDGTFRELLTEQIQHTSRFSMGVDMADINNDGFGDIISLDMHPYDPITLKSAQGENALDVFNFKLRYGYAQQYAFNNLQLNRGNGTFSEIARFAGIFATDWSWAPLFLDFDNDGYKDLFVSNGIPRRMNDLDYINFRMNSDLRWKANANDLDAEDLLLVEKMPRIKLPNKFFHNSGKLQFEEFQTQIHGNLPSYSNGAVYADLDNDGDLEIVVNNIEDKPFVYQNLTIENGASGKDYVALKLSGTPNNINAIGTKVIIYKGSEKLFYEYFPTRGFQSSMLTPLHIGLGDIDEVDSLLIIWPDHGYQVITHPDHNQTLDLKWEKGLPQFDFGKLHKEPVSPFEMVDITTKTRLEYEHKENPFLEFRREGLIPHMVSSEGPALAIGDLNADGLEDVFLGSSKHKTSAVFIQTPEGTFENRTPVEILNDSLFEDVDAVFVDIENDGDLDIAVASGGNEFWNDEEPRLQRIYFNDGDGSFFVDKEIFGETFLTASCVLPADFNKDGLVDLFFGARAVPWNYGKTPKSYLFENKGDGHFEEVTKKYSDKLAHAGLVKNGAWADIDQDGDSDLILALEWDAIQVYVNQGNSFEKRKLNDLNGWWNYVLPYDFDQDGDIDILAGNLGKNSKLRPSKTEPVRLYINDFDGNGQIEQVLTYYLAGREIPFANHEETTTQLESVKKNFLLAQDFAKASLHDLFGEKELSEAELLEVNTFESVLLENIGGDLEFQTHILPDELQLSTLNAAALFDFAGKGSSKIVLGGNFYDNNIAMGRYDASYGHILTISENSDLTVFPIGNLNIKGQVKRIERIQIGGENCLIIAKNNAMLQVIKHVR
jgi:hypothetical protein